MKSKAWLAALLLPFLSLSDVCYSQGDQTVPRYSIEENTLMLYYEDLSEVVPFYEEKLGLVRTFCDDWVRIYRLTPTSSVGLVQAGEESFHPARTENSVMLSIVTAEVDKWYEYLKKDGDIVFLKEIYDNENVPIRAFLMQDPGGYTIEFFQWLEEEPAGQHE